MSNMILPLSFFVFLVSLHHLSSEAHEEQVQIHRGGATDKEGEQQPSSVSCSYFIRIISNVTALSCFTGHFLTKIASRQTRAGQREGELCI